MRICWSWLVISIYWLHRFSKLQEQGTRQEEQKRATDENECNEMRYKIQIPHRCRRQYWAITIQRGAFCQKWIELHDMD